MFCFKCGTELKENADFCHECGTIVKEVHTQSQLTSFMTMASPIVTIRQVKKRRKVFPIVLFSSLFIVAIAIGIFILVNSNSVNSRFQEQLDLGNEYLQEFDYTHAIAAFETAIDIDSKNIEPYKGLVEAYAGRGNTDKILVLYDKASNNLIDSDLDYLRVIITDIMMEMIEDSLAEEKYDASFRIVDSLEIIDSEKARNALDEIAEFTRESEITGEVIDDVQGASEVEIETPGEELTNETESVMEIYQPTDEEVTDAYNAAMWILMDIDMSWGQFVQYTGENSSDILHITNFHSVNELNSILDDYFTAEKIQELDSIFFEQDGELCCRARYRNTDQTLGDSWVSEVRRVSETEIQVIVQQEELVDWPHVVGGYFYITFTYMYIDGKWVFNDLHPII